MRINKILSIAAGLTLAIVAGVALGASSQATQANSPKAFSSWTQDVTPATPAIDGWAVVNANATLKLGKNAVSVKSAGTGFFVVRFKTNVRRCAYIATTGLSDHTGNPPAAYATVNSSSNSVNDVFIETFNSTGTFADEGFHLVVMC